MARYTVIVVLIGALSIAAYHGVEKPLHNSPVLVKFKSRSGRRVAWCGWWNDTQQPAILGMLGILVVITAVLASLTPAVGRVAAAASPGFAVPTRGGDATSDPAQTQLTNEIVAALNATSFPEFDPALNSLGLANLRNDWRKDGCAEVNNDSEAEECTFGDPASTKTAVVIGDSYAMSWMPGLRNALIAGGYRVTQLTKGQCPAWNVSVTMNGAEFTECRDQHTWRTAYVSEHRPSLVVLSSAAYLADRLSSKNTGDERIKEISNGLKSVISRAKDAGARVVILGSPPGSENLQTCGSRMPCREVAGGRRQRIQGASSARRLTPRPRWASTTWTSPPGSAGLAAARICDDPVYADGSHITIEYSERLAP